ncbi:MAG: ArnT family glycosyltransferase [Planctomycetota bacterium]
MTSPEGLLDPLDGWGYGRRSTLLFVAFVVGVALYDLGSRSLHVHDTARWGLLAREMVQGGEWLVPHRYGELYVNKPPLYLWLVAAPSALLGEVTPFFVRLPSAIGLVLLVLGTAAWGRLRLGSAKAARFAALLALATPSVLWLGREGRLDMLGSGLAVVGAWQVDLAASGRGTRRTPWVAGLLLGLALLVKGPPLLLAPVLAACLPFPGQPVRARWRTSRPWIVLPVAVAVALLWFVPAVLQAGWQAYGQPLLVGQAADRLAGESTHTHGALYYLGAIAEGMGPFGVAYLALGLFAFTPRGRRLLGQGAGPARLFLVGVLLFALVPTKHVRYLAPLVPFGALGLASALLAWRGERGLLMWKRLAWVGTVALLLVAPLLMTWGTQARYGHGAPVVVPAAALLLFAAASLAALRRGALAPDVVARAGLAVGVTLFLVAGLAHRSRWFTTDKEQLVEAIRAARTEGDRVVTVHGTTPETIFHAAEQAACVPDPRDVPWDGHPGAWIVLARAERIAEVEAAAGRPAVLVAERPDAHEVALRLAALPGDDGRSRGD